MSEQNISQKTSAEIAALLKARNPLLWIASPEEGRVEAALLSAALSANYDLRLWDCVNGVTEYDGKSKNGGGGSDIMTVLAEIRASTDKAVWVLRDLTSWVKNDPMVLRAVRNLARTLPSLSPARTIIVLAPSADVPPELSDHAIVVKWPLPDRAEISGILDTVVEGYPEDKRALMIVDGERDAVIEAAVGLSAEGAASCYSKSIVTNRGRILPAVVSAEKRRVISREAGIEWFDPDPRGLEAVGGLENYKSWLKRRQRGYSAEARDFNLPTPKGVLLVGIPGTGKSLVAKATAAAFGCPLLRADFGAAQSKWVGESQANIRKVFSVVDAIGMSVLWIDEIEKALAGATAGAADGGVSSDALGVLLTWMQEHKGPCFIIATSNDVSKLPPELLRKGRFDELFFVDLPTRTEREDIIRVVMAKYGQAKAIITVSEVAAVTDGFTGAEIDALMPEAMFEAFADNKRAVVTSDLLKAARETVPLSKTAKDKIDELRKWSQGRARPAGREEVQAPVSRGRVLDI